MATIFERVKEVVVERLGVDEGEVVPEASVQSGNQRIILCVRGLNAKKIDEKIRPFNEIIGMKLNTKMTIGKKEYVIENDSYKNPISTHVAMHMLGMIDEPYVRLPLSQLTDEGYKKVGKILLQMYRKNPEIFEPIKRHFKVDIERKLKCYE